MKNFLVIGIVFILVLIGGVVFTLNRYGSNLRISQPQTTKTPTITDSKTPNPTLSNPASENCLAKGGTLTMQQRGDGGEYGLCNFEDAYACEEWALMRGDCPVEGVKTTGFDTVAQKYCAWVGGHTLAEPNAKCTFKDGKVCLNDDLYSGKCLPN